jgi:hypothetical protein
MHRKICERVAKLSYSLIRNSTVSRAALAKGLQHEPQRRGILMAAKGLSKNPPMNSASAGFLQPVAAWSASARTGPEILGDALVLEPLGTRNRLGSRQRDRWPSIVVRHCGKRRQAVMARRLGCGKRRRRRGRHDGNQDGREREPVCHGLTPRASVPVTPSWCACSLVAPGARQVHLL